MLFVCLVLTGLLVLPQLSNIHVQIDFMQTSQDFQESQLCILNFSFPILFTFVYILSLSSTFSIVLCNSFMSTSKIVNGISLLFYYFVSHLAYSDISHWSITQQEDQLVDPVIFIFQP